MDLLYTLLNVLANLPLLLQIAIAPVLLGLVVLAFNLTVAVLWISWSFVFAVLKGDI